MTQAQTVSSPPPGPASLYFGQVMHARLKPIGHRFAYSVFCLLIDIDQLPQANRASRWFSINRFNLLSFRPSDHGSGTPLRQHVETLLAPTGVIYDQIALLCYPRVLGFAFNPISVYFCYAQGQISALIYEVRNTFGQKHSYVAPVGKGELSPAGVRQERGKLFYVSPFMDMDLLYRFRLRPPAETVALRILACDKQGPLLAATFSGQRRALANASVLAAFFGLPLMTAKVVGGIHWEALKLWIKGVALRARPLPPEASSFTSAQDLSPHAKPIAKPQA